MSKTSSKRYTDQDRSDLQALHGAIQKALQVEVDCTVSAVELGAYLKEVKDRALWKIDMQGRGSFYKWVSERHPIKTTMIKNYLVIGAALGKNEVAGRRISVKSLNVISRAEEEMRSFLIRLADGQESSTKVKRALLAARQALAAGASLKEAEERGEAALSQRQKRPAKPKGSAEVSLEEALRQALTKLEALAKDTDPSGTKPSAKDLDNLEALARDILAAVQKLKGEPESPKTPEPVTAVTDSLDAEYFLRLPRPKTSVPLASPPPVPAVSRALVDRIEPLLIRVAAILEGQRTISAERTEECIELANQALSIAQSGVEGPHPLLVRPMEWLAFLAHCCGDPSYAENMIRQILSLWQIYDNEDQGQVLDWQSCLGILYVRMGRLTEAQCLFSLVYKERARRLPKNHPLRELAEENLFLVALDEGSLVELSPTG